MSFQQHLEQHLSNISKDTTFNVYNLNSNLSKCSSPLIKKSSDDTYLRHRLILLSTPSIGFICGLETYEYTISSKEGKVKQHVIYISKVDTTITDEAITKGVTGKLILAYLESLPPQSSVFVFARAKPQYLFAHSATNTEKTVLGDRNLVSWWLHLLNKVSIDSTGWWFVPGIEDEPSALIESGARKRNWKSAQHIQWKYGTSYPPDAQAADVIPQFEDDAKSRFLKDNLEDDMSVSNFWEVLAFSEECGSGKITGFFELRLNRPEAESGSIKEEENTDDFTKFWNKLMELDFHDKESILASTHTAVQEIERIFDNSFQFQIKVKPKEQTKQVENSKRAAVNILSAGLIKRKKV